MNQGGTRSGPHRVVGVLGPCVLDSEKETVCEPPEQICRAMDAYQKCVSRAAATVTRRSGVILLMGKGCRLVHKRYTPRTITFLKRKKTLNKNVLDGAAAWKSSLRKRRKSKNWGNLILIVPSTFRVPFSCPSTQKLPVQNGPTSHQQHSVVRLHLGISVQGLT